MSKLTHARPGRLNLRLLALLGAVVVVVGAGVAVARYAQVRSLAARARSDGLAAYERGEWTEAVRQLRRALRRAPDDREVLRKYAEANLRTRPAERTECLAAAEALYRLVKLEPQDEAAFARLAQLRLGLRDFIELERLAARRIESHAHDIGAQLWLARAQIGRRNFDAARATLTPLLATLEGDPAARDTDIAEVCVLLSNLTEQADPLNLPQAADDWLNRAVERCPAHALALIERARLRMQRLSRVDAQERENLANAAREDLDRFAALTPGDAQQRLTAASLWAVLGNGQRSAAELSAIDALGGDTIAAAFPITADWVGARFRVAALNSLRQTPAPQDVGWVDEALRQLSTRAARTPVLADAVRILARAGRADDARALLRELEQSRAVDSTSEANDELAYLSAVVARAAGDDFAAINALEPLSLRTAERPAVWALLAEAYSRSGQGRRAVAALTHYLRLAPGDVAAQISLVQEYVRLRDWGRAVEVARAAQSARPDDFELALLRVESTLRLTAQADAAARPAELARMRAELDQLRAAEPQRVEIRILQANLALLEGAAADAERILRDALAECSDSLPAELELIEVLHRGEQHDAALAAARQAVVRHPESGVAHELLAELLLARGDAPAALSALRDAREQIPAGPQRRAAEIKLAVLELQNDARSTGLERLRQLAEAEPNDTRPPALLLSLPEVRADAAAAQALVDAIRRAEGEAGLTWRVEQAALWLAGDGWRTRLEEAVALLNRCVEADPAWDRPALLLGELHERVERTDLAEAVYRRLLTMNAGAAEVADRLLVLLDQAQRVADQQEVLRSLTLPRAALSEWRLAVALHARDFDQAADVLRLRMSNDAGDAAARVLMARLVFHQSGDADRALAYLEEAEAIAGDRTAIIATRVAILEAAGRSDAALDLLSERVARRGDFESLWMRGAFLARSGRMEEAEADYAALPAAAEDARGYEMLGAFCEQQGRLDAAIAAWEAGLLVHADGRDVARRLAAALLRRNKEGDRARAGAIAADLQQRRADDPDVLLLRATWLMLDPTGQAVAEATALLEQVVRLNPRGVDGHLALFRLAMEAESYSRARDLAIRALGAAGDDARLFAARAQAELACGNARLAREMTRTAWRTPPHNATALDVFAAATIALHDDSLLNEAIAELQQAQSDKGGSPRHALALARMLEAARRNDEAVAVLQRAAADGGDRPDVALLLALAEVHARQRAYPAAGELIERARAVDPVSPAVLQARVMWLAAQRRHAELADVIRAAPAESRDWPQVLSTAGAALAASPDSGHRQFAAELLEHALSRLPSNSPVRLDVAGQLYGVGAIDRAEAEFRAAVERSPDNARALNDLAWLLAEGRGRPAEALALADRGVLIDPDNIDVRDTRGYILLRLGQRLSDARIDFQHCVDRTPPNSPARARALLRLAQVTAALGDRALAGRHFAAADAIDRSVKVFTPAERADADRLWAEIGGQVE